MDLTASPVSQTPQKRDGNQKAPHLVVLHNFLAGPRPKDDPGGG